MKTRVRVLLSLVAFACCVQAVLIGLLHPAPGMVVQALAGLLLAHLIADFPLQADWVHRMKLCSLAGLAIHAAMHVFATALILHESLLYWPVLALVGLTHFAVDWFKPRWRGAGWVCFLLDQLIHVTILALIAALIPVQPALPAGLLYPALVYAILPAILVALWIFSRDQRAPGRVSRWMRYHLLDASKVFGALLVATLSLWFVIRG